MRRRGSVGSGVSGTSKLPSARCHRCEPRGGHGDQHRESPGAITVNGGHPVLLRAIGVRAAVRIPTRSGASQASARFVGRTEPGPSPCRAASREPCTFSRATVCTKCEMVWGPRDARPADFGTQKFCVASERPTACSREGASGRTAGSADRMRCKSGKSPYQDRLIHPAPAIELAKPRVV